MRAVLFVALLLGCATGGGLVSRGMIPEVAPLEPIYELSVDMPLREKAAGYLDAMIEGHVSTEGLLLYQAKQPLSESDNYLAAHNLADGPSWTGHALAAAAFMQAVEPSGQGAWLLERLTAGLERFFLVTGHRGYLARSYVRTDARLPWMATQEHRPGKYWQEGLGGFWYRNGPAKGHVLAAAFGPAMALELADRRWLELHPALELRLRQIVVDLAARVRACGMNVCDPVTGIPTQFGLLGEWQIDGFSALMLVALQRAAAMAGDPEAEIALEQLIKGGAGTAIANTLTDLGAYYSMRPSEAKPSETQHVYTAALMFWFLSDDSDTELLSDIRAGLRATWQYERWMRNPFTIYAHQLVMGGTFYENAIARETLTLFPAEKWDIRPYQQEETPCCVQPIPNRDISSHSFKSKRFKRAVLEPGAGPTKTRYSGQDFLEAYWMARWATWVN